MTQVNTAVWFEIPAADFKRAIKFYQTVLNLELKQEECGGIKMAVFPHAGQAVSGAIIIGEGYAPGANGTIVYLNGGQDLALPLSRVAQAGGQIKIPKTLISPEIGYFAQFIDSEGNRVGLHSLK